MTETRHPAPNPQPPTPVFNPPWFVRSDLDGFFGLFIDNLLQLMLIAVLCKVVSGLPSELITVDIAGGCDFDSYG